MLHIFQGEHNGVQLSICQVKLKITSKQVLIHYTQASTTQNTKNLFCGLILLDMELKLY